jgi:hypothetical protein
MGNKYFTVDPKDPYKITVSPTQQRATEKYELSRQREHQSRKRSLYTAVLSTEEKAKWLEAKKAQNGKLTPLEEKRLDKYHGELKTMRMFL